MINCKKMIVEIMYKTAKKYSGKASAFSFCNKQLLQLRNKLK